MTVEINPVGLRCPKQCVHCYEHSVKKNEKSVPIDHEAIQCEVKKENPKDTGFTLFGGEPLLTSVEDLAKLWEFGFQTYKKNGVQTDGALITEKHLELFKQFKVHVGFSIDGPEELNDARWAGTLARTRASTEKSIEWLKRCLNEKIDASLILTLHKHNGTIDRLPKLIKWLEELDSLKISRSRVHIMQGNGESDSIALNQDENLRALMTIYNAQVFRFKRLSFDVFDDILLLLQGKDERVTCHWNGCDPWHTSAVRGIEADGSRSLCHHVHHDGQAWQPMKHQSFFRILTLRKIPQSSGGCKGCRFFIFCKGQCPGTAINKDWRNRSENCQIWFRLFSHFEQLLRECCLKPISLRNDLREIEERMIEAWELKRHVTVKEALEAKTKNMHFVPGGMHGDCYSNSNSPDFRPFCGGEKVNE